MGSRQRLPEEYAYRPHVAPRRRIRPTEPLRGDVGESPWDISDCSQRVGFVELGQSEVQELDRDFRAVLEEDVRGLDVPVDDAAGVRVCQGLQHLRGDLHCVPVTHALGSEHLAKRPPLHELVRDVDVTLVFTEVVGPDAARVAQP